MDDGYWGGPVPLVLAEALTAQQSVVVPELVFKMLAQHAPGWRYIDAFAVLLRGGPTCCARVFLTSTRSGRSQQLRATARLARQALTRVGTGGGSLLRSTVYEVAPLS